MPRGRPRITEEIYEERLAAYCAKYGVAPLPTGIPPFPAGARETRQHREWIALYKTHHRLGRRAPAEDRSQLLKAQDGRCPVCGEAVEPPEAADDWDATGTLRAVLHQRCHQLVGLVEPAGPEALDRLRAYLWPAKAPRRQ